MSRTIDRTKKSNIKCEHCMYWQPTAQTNVYTGEYLYSCHNATSPKYDKVCNYWNRCKQFDWKGGEGNE